MCMVIFQRDEVEACFCRDWCDELDTWCCHLCKRIPDFGNDGISGDFCDFALWLVDEAFHHPERSLDFETICGVCEELLLELCSVLGKGTFFSSAMVAGKAGDGGKKRSCGISSLCVDVNAYEVTEEIEPIPAEHVEAQSTKPAEKSLPAVSLKPVESVKQSSKNIPAGNRVKKGRQIHTGFSDSEDETPARSRKRRVIRYQPKGDDGDEGDETPVEGEERVGDKESVKDMNEESMKDMAEQTAEDTPDETAADAKETAGAADKETANDGDKETTCITSEETNTILKQANETTPEEAAIPARVDDNTNKTPIVVNDDSDWTDSDWSPAPQQSPRDSWSDASSPRIIHETPEKASNSTILTFSPRDPMMTATLPRFHNETPMPGSRLWWLLRCFLECKNTDVFRRLQMLRALRNASSAEIVQELVMAEIVGFVVSRELTEEAKKLVEECVNETSEVAIRSALDETLARLREFHPVDAASVSLMTQMIWLHLIGYRHLPEN